MITPEAPPNVELLKRMRNTLRHRGPDDEGLWVGSNEVLGSRRLSIIDLDGGRMPISNETGDMWVTYNGELYNHNELRRELESLGHKYRTRSDAETVIHAYEEWGENAGERFNGMFAAAVWDGRAKKLWLVRDQLGQKPLYYTTRNGQMLFASEMKALQVHPDCPSEPDQSALSLYLQLGYVPSPTTWLRDVKQLPAGCWLTWQKNEIRTGKYWSAEIPEEFEEDVPTLKRQVRERVIRAVESRCMSDVPVGAFLSGGVDSTLVAGIVRRELGKPLKTFSVGFDTRLGGNAKFNADREYANLAAKFLETDHHEMVFADETVMEPELCRLHWYLDQPNYQPTVLAQQLVSRLARKEVKVCLSGDGGDELFGGYRRFELDQWLSLYSRLPLSMRQSLKWLLGKVPGKLGKLVNKGAEENSLNRYLNFHQFVDWKKQHEWRMDEREIREIRSDLEQSLGGCFPAELPRDFTPHFALGDTRLWLGEMSNACWDRVAMGESLEVRAPLQDHELVAFAQHIPFRHKIRNQDRKWILKEAFSDLLPEAIRNRPKWGFIQPASHWVRTSLRPLVERVLSREAVSRANLVRPDKVWAVTQRHLEKTEYGLPVLWQMLSLHLWHEIHIQGRHQNYLS